MRRFAWLREHTPRVACRLVSELRIADVIRVRYVRSKLSKRLMKEAGEYQPSILIAASYQIWDLQTKIARSDLLFSRQVGYLRKASNPVDL